MSHGSDKPFRFRQFEVHQANSAMKVGTDAVLLGCWVNVENAGRLLDVGTGTGVIALICAQRNLNARIEAIEIDHPSANEARLNFSISPWKDRMSVVSGDFLAWSADHHFDLIISNPPYFSHSLRATDPGRSTARHDDALPSDKFLSKAAGMLSEEGRIALIFPAAQLEKWIEQAALSHLYPLRICHVFTLAHKAATRVMIEFGNGYPGEPEMESLLVERSPGEFSESYKQLTREFYTRW